MVTALWSVTDSWFLLVFIDGRAPFLLHCIILVHVSNVASLCAARGVKVLGGELQSSQGGEEPHTIHGKRLWPPAIRAPHAQPSQVAIFCSSHTEGSKSSARRASSSSSWG